MAKQREFCVEIKNKNDNKWTFNTTSHTSGKVTRHNVFVFIWNEQTLQKIT